METDSCEGKLLATDRWKKNQAIFLDLKGFSGPHKTDFFDKERAFMRRFSQKKGATTSALMLKVETDSGQNRDKVTGNAVKEEGV